MVCTYWPCVVLAHAITDVEPKHEIRERDARGGPCCVGAYMAERQLITLSPDFIKYSFHVQPGRESLQEKISFPSVLAFPILTPLTI